MSEGRKPDETVYISNSGSGGCVEVGEMTDGQIAVRNSRERGTPPLRFTAGEWAAFVAGVKKGIFDFDTL